MSGDDLHKLANYNRAKRLGLVDNADDVRAPPPACLIWRSLTAYRSSAQFWHEGAKDICSARACERTGAHDQAS